jgi:Cu/Ag efflux protein CusF
MLQEVTMKTGKMLFAAMFAIGFGNSCAYAQTPSTAAQPLPSSAQTTTATTATFTAVVAKVDTAAGAISLTQTLSAKPTALHDSPTATADYLASPVLLNKATVGATVQATVQRVNGKLALVALNGVVAMPQVPPAASANSTSTLTTSQASNPAVSNPSRLTPSGAQ